MMEKTQCGEMLQQGKNKTYLGYQICQVLYFFLKKTSNYCIDLISASYIIGYFDDLIPFDHIESSHFVKMIPNPQICAYSRSTPNGHVI